jgi:hypothetical protein
MRIINHANLSDQKIAALEKELGEQRGLQDVLKWGLSQLKGNCLPRVVADVIAQDEFTHDVIVPWRELFLIYDTT